MMTRPGRPVLASVCWKPSAIASTETSTPTTPAMPTTITSDVPRRCGRLRRLISVIWVIWCSALELIGRPASSTMRRRRARSAGGRPTASATITASAAASAHVVSVTNSGGKRPPVEPLTAGSSACGGGHAQAGAEAEEQHGLGQHEGRHARVGEAERLENGQLGNPLAHRLRHRVAGEDQDGEEDRDENARDHRADVADLLGEADGELLLGRGLRLVGGIGEEPVDLRRDGFGLLGVRDALDVPAGLAAPELARLVEVGHVDQHHVGVAAHGRILGVDHADEIELPVEAPVALAWISEAIGSFWPTFQP
jgi:hypothetical protein